MKVNFRMFFLLFMASIRPRKPGPTLIPGVLFAVRNDCWGPHIRHIVHKNLKIILPWIFCVEYIKQIIFGYTNIYSKENSTIRWDLLVQACLRASPVVADEAKLAIVFTYFFLLFSFFLFFSSFSFHPLRGISRAWKFVSPNILA